MNIIELLAKLAEVKPTNESVNGVMEAQVDSLKQIISKGNSAAIKCMLSPSNHFSNETKVTLY